MISVPYCLIPAHPLIISKQHALSARTIIIAGIRVAGLIPVNSCILHSILFRSPAVLIGWIRETSRLRIISIECSRTYPFYTEISQIDNHTRWHLCC